MCVSLHSLCVCVRARVHVWQIMYMATKEQPQVNHSSSFTLCETGSLFLCCIYQASWPIAPRKSLHILHRSAGIHRHTDTHLYMDSGNPNSGLYACLASPLSIPGWSALMAVEPWIQRFTVCWRSSHSNAYRWMGPY